MIVENIIIIVSLLAIGFSFSYLLLRDIKKYTYPRNLLIELTLNGIRQRENLQDITELILNNGEVFFLEGDQTRYLFECINLKGLDGFSFETIDKKKYIKLIDEFESAIYYPKK